MATDYHTGAPGSRGAAGCRARPVRSPGDGGGRVYAGSVDEGGDTGAAPGPGDYVDLRVRCTGDGIELVGYYFPWGSKHIRYEDVHGIRRVDLGAARGRTRIWGTANPGYWANFDPGRPRKSTGFVVDLGRRVKPLVTPDDPDDFEAVVRARSGLGPVPPGGPSRAPIV